MGSLALGGLIGLKVRLVIMGVLHDEFGDPKYRPHPHLQKMVHTGQLGHKRSAGFYSHTKEPAASTHCRCNPNNATRTVKVQISGLRGDPNRISTQFHLAQRGTA